MICTFICVVDEFVFWFVCIASHGKRVFATKAIQSQQDSKLNFRESLQFVGLPKDFVITLEVYSLRLRRVILPDEDRYHIEQVCVDRCSYTELHDTTCKLFRKVRCCRMSFYYVLCLIFVSSSLSCQSAYLNVIA